MQVVCIAGYCLNVSFKRYTCQIHYVEFGYLDNRRNGVVVLYDILLMLRHDR